MSDFNKAPKSTKRAVLNRTMETYSPLDDVDGKQPYYSYQGVGRVTALGNNVVHNTVPVIHNNTQVIHTT